MADNINDTEDFGEEGEFNESPKQGDVPGQPPMRVRLPRGNEVLGKVESRAGANRMIIACFDGKTRNCRIPGRLKRALWVRQGNIVLIQPWEFEGDKRGDIIFSYTPNAVQILERKGYLKGIKNEF